MLTVAYDIDVLTRFLFRYKLWMIWFAVCL